MYCSREQLIGKRRVDFLIWVLGVGLDAGRLMLKPTVNVKSDLGSKAISKTHHDGWLNLC